MAQMIGTGRDFQVFVGVVALVLVGMMHDFLRGQIAPEACLNNQSMLVDKAGSLLGVGMPRFEDKDVTPSVANPTGAKPFQSFVFLGLSPGIAGVSFDETQGCIADKVLAVTSHVCQQCRLTAATFAEFDKLKARWGRLVMHTGLLCQRAAPGLFAATPGLLQFSIA